MEASEKLIEAAKEVPAIITIDQQNPHWTQFQVSRKLLAGNAQASIIT